MARQSIAFTAHDIPTALATVDGLLARWPSPRRRLDRIHMLIAGGRSADAAAALDELEALHEDPRLDGEVQCTRAELAPDPVAAQEFASKACSSGFAACCGSGGAPGGSAPR